MLLPSGSQPMHDLTFLLLRRAQSDPTVLCKWQHLEWLSGLLPLPKLFLSLHCLKYLVSKAHLLVTHFHSQQYAPLKLNFSNLHTVWSLKSALETCSFSPLTQHCCTVSGHNKNKKRRNIPSLFSHKPDQTDSTYLYLILVWDGRSLLEYCLDSWLKSPSPFPLPPLAGSNVGLAAVVILVTTKSRAKSSH